MAAAVLLRSVTRKMSCAAAPTSLVARGLHGGARLGSGPANSNQVQQGTADVVLASTGMAAATGGLGSGARWLTTKMAHAPPPPYHHRLVDGRGIHSRTSPDPIPSTPPKVVDTSALDKATAGMAYIALVSAAIYMHFWVKPKTEELAATIKDLRKTTLHVVKEMQATIMDLKAENAKLKVALDSARSQGKV